MNEQFKEKENKIEKKGEKLKTATEKVTEIETTTQKNLKNGRPRQGVSDYVKRKRHIGAEWRCLRKEK